MPLRIKNKSSKRSVNKSVDPSFQGYTCIGSYEDKPKNRVYYFLYSEDDIGTAGKYDCIAEYDQVTNKSTIVYQDGRYGSNRVSENVLNFSKGHIITGVNKVDDFLYWTDNLNRPRKINVEKAKKNEVRINSGPIFEHILMESGGDADSYTKVKIYRPSKGAIETTTQNLVLTGITQHPFVQGDHLYVQQSLNNFDSENMAYNGYSEAIGIVKPFQFDSLTEDPKVTLSNGSDEVNGVGTTFIDQFDPGDYVCINKHLGSNKYAAEFYEIKEVRTNTKLILSVSFQGVSGSYRDKKNSNSSGTNKYINLDNWAELNSDNDYLSYTLNTSFAIITNTPIVQKSLLSNDSVADSPGGRIFYANPDDAYSPIISFGSRKDKIKYVDALSHQPKDEPSFSLSNSNSKVNHLLGKFFQFRYRYVYDDGSVSAYSGISDVVNQNAYARIVANQTHSNISKMLYNVININYNDSTSNVDKIEVIARDGNNGEFFLVDTINNDFIKYLKKIKNEDLFATPGFYFGGADQDDVKFSSVEFQNNGVYPFVSKDDTNKLQDALPKLAKAQTVLPKNRIAYGNVVDGYDNTDIYCHLTVEQDGNIASSEQSINFKIDDSSLVSGGPSTDVVITLIACSSDGSDTDFTNLVSINDISSTNNPVEVNIAWTKVLYQHHNQNPNFYGTSLVPRSGRIIYTSEVPDPQSAEDVALNIVDGINNNEATISNVQFSYVLEGQYITNSDDPVQQNLWTKPTSVVAQYSSSNELKIVATYDADDFGLAGQAGSHIFDTPNFSTELNDGTAPIHDQYSPGELVNGFNMSDSDSFYKESSHFGKSYKTGANHSFGLVYYDETNRASSVNTSKPIGTGKNSTGNSGTEVYSPFYSEDGNNKPQSFFNKVSWKIFHKPPIWATHYQWVYAGNTSVDEFIQIPIQNAYKGTAQSETIYLGLGSLKGRPTSYNDEHPSLLDYEYVEGDRVRFISFGGNEAGGEDVRKYFKQNIDVPISSYGLYDEAELVDETTGTATGTVIPGYYIVIQDPSVNGASVPFSTGSGFHISGTADVSYSSVDITDSDNGYHKLVVEIYRPKKAIEGVESSADYYEVGEKLEIENSGTHSRTHKGQPNDFFFDSNSGMMVTATNTNNRYLNVHGEDTDNYASGSLTDGDVYVKTRKLSHQKTASNASKVETMLNCEDYYLSDFYASNNWNKGRVNIANPYSEERRLSASVYYSDIYSSTENYNGLSTFDMGITPAPYYDYNQDFGSIQKLDLRGDDLIIFHENKVGRALVGKNIINYADGDSNLSLSSDILSDYAQVYSGNNGCSLNPESVVKHKDRFYFADIKRGAVLRLGGDGLTRISDYGMSDYIRDKGELYTMLNPEESTDGEFKIVAGYDPKYDEYIITFSAIIDTSLTVESSGIWSEDISDWDSAFSVIRTLRPSSSGFPVTIAYNDSLKKWTSFYTYAPEFYGKINRQFVTFKNGELYKQNSPLVNFNTFYGERNPSSIEFAFNAEPSSVKSYNAISLESDTKLLTTMSTNMGQHNNSYEDVVSTNIGYRSVPGEAFIIIGTLLSFTNLDGSTYKHFSPGDLIKFKSIGTFGTQYDNDGNYDSYIYNTVKRIINKNSIELYDTVEGFLAGHIEVVDYKSKEGIQYSQIPFAPSKINNYEGTEFEGNYDGDASNIFGLGLFIPEINGNTGILTGEVVKSLPFKGDKRVPASKIISGAKYITIDNPQRSSSSSLGPNILSESTSDFSDSSNWTVVSSGVSVQSDTTGSEGNVALFNSQATPAEIRTTASLSFDSGKNYKVTFYVDTLGNKDGDARFKIRLGGNSNFIHVTSQETNKPNKEMKSIQITAGSEDLDPHLYIKALEETGSFSISNIQVQLTSTPNTSATSRRTDRSDDLVVTSEPVSIPSKFPSEYSLYCLDQGTGDSTHEGWVYNIKDDSVYYKLTDEAMGGRSARSSTSSGYNSSSREGNQKFYFIVKEGLVDGEKLKGHYLKTKLTSHWYQSKYKFNLYGANVDVDKSELSNR